MNATTPLFPVLRGILLWVALAGWFLFFMVPLLSGIHEADRFHFAENLPFVLIGLSLWHAAEAAHHLHANIPFVWFITVLAITASWF